MKAKDGVRIRLCLWNGSEHGKGTVFIFPGIRQYAEQYHMVATDLAQQGFFGSHG